MEVQVSCGVDTEMPEEDDMLEIVEVIERDISSHQSEQLRKPSGEYTRRQQKKYRCLDQPIMFGEESPSLNQ
jgi:hypothetical protein